MPMDSDYEFTEEEIRKELENLGYHDVHNTRLTEFKRDLQNLIEFDRSKSDSSISGGVPHSEESFDDVDHKIGTLIDLTDASPMRDAPTTMATAGQEFYPDALQHTATRGVRTQGDNVSAQKGSAHTKLKVVQSYPKPSTTQKFSSLPAPASNSAIAGHNNAQHSTDQHNTSSQTADTTASDHSFMRRKVLRKVNGRSEVFDESSVADTDDSELNDIEERLRSLGIDIPCRATQSRNPWVSHDGRPHSAMIRRSVAVPERRPQSAQAAYRLPDDYDGPTSLIKGMKVDPHKRNIKKTDPVNRYQQYRQSWSAQRAPGEKKHKSLRWNVREHMLYHDEVVKKKRPVVPAPNSYVIPSDKKRKSLRWQIRMDMAQGVIPESKFN